jgi:hypothetical protein
MIALLSSWLDGLEEEPKRFVSDCKMFAAFGGDVDGSKGLVYSGLPAGNLEVGYFFSKVCSFNILTSAM